MCGNVKIFIKILIEYVSAENLPIFETFGLCMINNGFQYKQIKYCFC